MPRQSFVKLHNDFFINDVQHNFSKLFIFSSHICELRSLESLFVIIFLESEPAPLLLTYSEGEIASNQDSSSWIPTVSPHRILKLHVLPCVPKRDFSNLHLTSEPILYPLSSLTKDACLSSVNQMRRNMNK